MMAVVMGDIGGKKVRLSKIGEISLHGWQGLLGVCDRELLCSLVLAE
jgi:hypothetical protein